MLVTVYKTIRRHIQEYYIGLIFRHRHENLKWTKLN
jgi:hypothetical protein